MRGKSIFGPVFLILLGIVLLVHNLNPRFSVLQLFALYWPWILVFWGSFRLAESAMTRALGKPRPEPLGPAALVLALLLCFAGSTAHAIVGNHGEFLEWFFERGGHFHLKGQPVGDDVRSIGRPNRAGCRESLLLWIFIRPILPLCGSDSCLRPPPVTFASYLYQR